MKLTGIELQNFRSVGMTPVVLKPLQRCNILVGQNNTGKSNVIRAVQKISDRYQQSGNRVSLSDLDPHKRSLNTPFLFKLWFEANTNNSAELELSRLAKTSVFWFDISWQYSKAPAVVDYTLAHITDFRQSNELLNHIAQKHWTRTVPAEQIRGEFLSIGDNFFTSFSHSIPPAYAIPEFRQIRPGDEYALDGRHLVDLLAHYHMPVIGKDADQQKFNQIQEFLRRLLHLPRATLEISRADPTIIIRNDDLRLPLSSFGTGVHELFILVTAVLSIENAICCIEEPEIHLYPRLQRELIEFLITETSNTYFLSTHSAALINAASTNPDIQVFHLSAKDGVTVGVPVLQKVESLHALRDLGLKASDLLQVNCILWVEGLSDRIYLQRLMELLAPNLVEGRDYVFMYYSQMRPLSIEMDSVASELINVLQINRNMVLVIDSDRSSDEENLNSVKQLMKQKCEESGGLCWVTDGREIENYIPGPVAERACKGLRGVEVTIVIEPYDEFGDVIDKALKSVEAKPIVYSADKLNYSRKFAELFTQADVTGKLREHIEKVISQIRAWSNE